MERKAATGEETATMTLAEALKPPDSFTQHNVGSDP